MKSIAELLEEYWKEVLYMADITDSNRYVMVDWYTDRTIAERMIYSLNLYEGEWFGYGEFIGYLKDEKP